MRVINRSLSERRGNAASVHVVQVLVLLAVEDVVVDDLEASEARARRGPPMNARSLQRIRGAVPTWPSRPWLASSNWCRNWLCLCVPTQEHPLVYYLIKQLLILDLKQRMFRSIYDSAALTRWR